MNLEKILSTLNENYSPLSNECQQELIASFNILELNKGDIIVSEGQFADKAYLIIKGCARAYYLKDGKDISDWFTFENEFICSIISFFGNTPSPHYIELVEDSIIIEIPRHTIDNLSSKHLDFLKFVNIVITETMLGLQERLTSILFNKAEDRYKQFISIHPNITNRIPLTHIASYLGITLETLSRIRNPKKRI